MAGAEEKKKKEVPPSPPRVLYDAVQETTYHREEFLGEGGFARVYAVEDEQGIRRAAKVVNKANIKTKKNKTKLWAEIKLHQMLDHPHIVKFQDCFEDGENIYLLLEICEGGSLMHMLRKRKRFTEPEARVLLVQIIAACQYMHQTNVIHRDLKLGNIFLSSDLSVKVGDLGLAALIENPGDRKKTICGTPNYIAPEVLFDQTNGHSFEVDVWSIGVILYTLLVGKPPFQTDDVKAIYRRIKENRYTFPKDKPISDSARDLIVDILNQDPQKRPTLKSILEHQWFSDGPFPPYLPINAAQGVPDFRSISKMASRRNFEAVCYRAKMGEAAKINVDQARTRVPLGPSIMKQEEEFKKAVQPDSPVSALVKSARQPLVHTYAQIREPALLRKLTDAGAQATLSPARRVPVRGNAQAGPSTARTPMGRVQEEEEPIEEIEDHSEEEALQDQIRPRGYEAAVRERELAAQKARIVSQMATPPAGRHERAAVRKEHERASPRKPVLTNARTVSSAMAAAPAAGMPSLGHARSTVPAKAPAPQERRPYRPVTSKSGLFDRVRRNLEHAVAMSETAEGYRGPDLPDPLPTPRVFVVSWLDYCSKYGMGIAMTDGTVGVHFNDSTSIALAPTKQHFDYIQPTAASIASRDRVEGQRTNYSITHYPEDLSNKVYLLTHFEKYMISRLAADTPYTYEDTRLTAGMVFVSRYLRMRHVIVFRLSNDLLQFNFYDHVKLLFSHDGHVVTIIDKNNAVWTWSLAELLAPVDDSVSPKEKRRIESTLHKLGYARDVLSKIETHEDPVKTQPAIENVEPPPREPERTASRQPITQAYERLPSRQMAAPAPQPLGRLPMRATERAARPIR